MKKFKQKILVCLLILLPFNKILAESFLEKLMRYTGIDITTSRVRGSFIEGNLWIVNLDESGSNEPKKITNDGTYHSPLWIPDSNNILAVKKDQLIQLNNMGNDEKVRHIFSKNTILLGFDKNDLNSLLILQGTLPAIFYLASNQLIPLPFDKEKKENRHALDQLLNSYRHYGNTEVFIEKQSRADGKGSFKKINKIHIKSDDQDIAISCPDSCAQPALRTDGKQLIFVGQ